MTSGINVPLRKSPSGPRAAQGIADDHIYVNQVTFPPILFDDLGGAGGEVTKESFVYIWPFPVVVVGTFDEGHYPTTQGYEVVVNPSRNQGEPPNPEPNWFGQGGSISHVRIVRYNALPADFSGPPLAAADPITGALPDPVPPPATNGVIVALGMSALGLASVTLDDLKMDLIFLRQVEPTLHSSVPDAPPPPA